MKCNRLALSISKTNFILFHSSKLKPNQSLRIKIDDTPIKQVDSKYLGITFDSNLTWKSHIQARSQDFLRVGAISWLYGPTSAGGALY